MKETTKHLETELIPRLKYQKLAKEAISIIQQELEVLEEYGSLEAGVKALMLPELTMAEDQCKSLVEAGQQLCGRSYVSIDSFVERGAHEGESPYTQHLRGDVIRCYIAGTGRPLVGIDVSFAGRAALERLEVLRDEGAFSFARAAKRPKPVFEAAEELLRVLEGYVGALE